MTTQKTVYKAIRGNLITGAVRLVMEHQVILDDGQVLIDNTKPTKKDFIFSDILNTPATTPDAITVDQVTGQDEKGQDIIEKVTVKKKKDRATVYAERLAELESVISKDHLHYAQIKSVWDGLLATAPKE